MSDEIDAVIASMGWDLDQQEWADMRRLCEAVLAQQPAVTEKPVAYVNYASNGQPYLDWLPGGEDESHALYTAPPAPEQPDTVIVSRELAERLCHRDNYTRQMARRELRNMLLAGGAE